LIDQPVKIKSGSFIPQGDLDGEIEFSKTSFAYPTKTDVDVLKDVTFKVKAGQIVAFVGQSGSGKSTAISLILRFYDVSSGKILVDGHPID